MFEQFTNQYSLNKVLRFSLIPQGKTKENIEKERILEEDAQKAENYKKVKLWLDQYHKEFIDYVLNGVKLDNLGKYYEYYTCSNRTEKEEKEFSKLKDSIRSQISKAFKSSELYKGMFGKEVIKKYLPKFLKDEMSIAIIQEFDNFTTYFKGYNENRANMYTDEDKSTAIAYRLITQNLPKFIDNMYIFEKIKNCTELLEKLQEVDEKLESFKKGKLEEVFCIEYYNHVLTNQGIQAYNTLIGGYTDDKKNKIQGINEYINLYNQQLPSTEKKIPKLKPLFKQILSDRQEISFIEQKIEQDEIVLERVREWYTNLNEELMNPKNGIPIKEVFSNIEKYNKKKIYLKNDQTLTLISKQLYGDWSLIQKGLNILYDKSYTGKIDSKKNNEKYEDERKKMQKKQTGFSLEILNKAILEVIESPIRIESYFIDMGIKENLLQKIQGYYEDAEELLYGNYPVEKNLRKDEENIEKIKNLLDGMLELQHFLKMFYIPEGDKDEAFYYELDRLQSIMNMVTPVYNQVRNYLTSKPYSIEKIKLNFKNSTLLKGWDKNKERDYTSIILKRDGKYYLGIMNKKNNDVFLEKNIPKVKSKECYEKMEYKQLPGPNKMFPKVFFSKKRRKEFSPSEEILEIRESDSFKKGSNFNIQDCHKLIDFLKESIEKNEDWKKFNFSFSDTKEYKNIGEFYREVEQQNYKISFRKIDVEYIDKLVESGQLYLFQIYNKDFSDHSHGRKNLHTIYWEMLFEQKNIDDVVYKLNGEAEVFYRKASLPKKITHPAHQPIKKKIPDKNGKYGESNFEYDLIKDKRYTIDQFQFHVSITLNYKAQGNGNINETVKNAIHSGEVEHVIGIDRGERNLLYISVVNLKGEIVHQESLNQIKGDTENVQDYHRLLSEKEKNRDQARKNWQSIEGIKDLKEGYLSQVIHRITQLMIEYQAIVVLEDLNFGFMRGRQKVEKQVYQKFEKMLIDKLNFYVDKNLEITEYGGALNAYQLTSKFISFQRLGKQSGFLFYIPAWNTSKMDPTTGFVNLLYPKYTSVKEAQGFLRKFEKINYNKNDKYFEFTFDYNNFTGKATGTRTDWTICTFGKRIESFRDSSKNGEWNYQIVDLSEMMKNLLNQYQIEYLEGEDIKDKIINLQNGDKEFYSRLLHILKLVLQIRNSIPNTETDYLTSPVKNDKGEFFNSTNAPDYLPSDADGNGAYNIARKGLWILEQIKNTQPEKLSKINMAISNKEWMQYAQKNRIL